MSQKTEKIKFALKDSLGQRCSVLYKQGRKKIMLKDCTVEAAYPEIFVISYYDIKAKKNTKLSFSYTDILTKTVCISKDKTQADKEGA